MTCWGGAEDSRGWPLPALRGRVFGATDPRADSVWFADHAAIYTSGPDPTTRMSESLATVRILPMEPIWRGIAIDIVALAAIWWLGLTATVAGTGAIKARFRIPAGHCPKCGYDLVGNLAGGCPECGWNRPDSPQP
jgi:hypothetical protein